MTLREQQEQLERRTLSPYAALSCESRGRERKETECDLRTAFTRDRDRVLHCKAFRRLKQKTQVFLSPEGDHYRTRMTHTLEVSQIARTIARALRLNEDLTEAIALGHDLGHTPFGHAGERKLNELMPGGFRHYEQSVRVVSTLEKKHLGLNLTFETIDGIRRHTTGAWASTLEGAVVRYADHIAYLNHDVEDAISAGLLSEERIPDPVHQVLGCSKSQRITALICSLVDHFEEGVLGYDPETQEAFDILKEFMYQTIYLNTEGLAKKEEYKAEMLVGRLYSYYAGDISRMPVYYQEIAWKEGPERAACDYISGMSDQFAIDSFKNIFIPKSWDLR